MGDEHVGFEAGPDRRYHARAAARAGRTRRFEALELPFNSVDVANDAWDLSVFVPQRLEPPSDRELPEARIGDALSDVSLDEPW